MTVRELLTQVRDVIQDTDGVYFNDSELLNIYNECKRYMASERTEIKTSITLDLIDGTSSYNIEGVLRFISAKDSNGKVRKLYPNDGSGDDDIDGIIIVSYNLVEVNNPIAGVTIEFKVVEFPTEDNLNDDIRVGDENAFKYYILSKAYEKDTDLEQFQKASYFTAQFLEAMKFNKKSSKVGYVNTVETTKMYSY